jgi:hypothetical protein
MLVSEHDALRLSISQTWSLIGQLTGLLVVIAAGAIPIVLQHHDQQFVLCLGAALASNLIAWSILLHCFRIFWKNSYIITSLRPRILDFLPENSDQILGWSTFGLRTGGTRSGRVVAFLCAIFGVCLLVLPTLGFVIAAFSTSGFTLYWPVGALFGAWVAAFLSMLMAIGIGAFETISLYRLSVSSGPGDRTSRER